jgi:hypothetical protein
MHRRPASSFLVAGRKVTWDTLLTALLKELGDEAGPASLVTSADAGPIIAVKIFVK